MEELDGTELSDAIRAVRSGFAAAQRTFRLKTG